MENGNCFHPLRNGVLEFAFWKLPFRNLLAGGVPNPAILETGNCPSYLLIEINNPALKKYLVFYDPSACVGLCLTGCVLCVGMRVRGLLFGPSGANVCGRHDPHFRCLPFNHHTFRVSVRSARDEPFRSAVRWWKDRNLLTHAHRND